MTKYCTARPCRYQDMLREDLARVHTLARLSLEGPRAAVLGMRGADVGGYDGNPFAGKKRKGGRGDELRDRCGRLLPFPRVSIREGELRGLPGGLLKTAFQRGVSPVSRGRFTRMRADCRLRLVRGGRKLCSRPPFLALAVGKIADGVTMPSSVRLRMFSICLDTRCHQEYHSVSCASACRREAGVRPARSRHCVRGRLGSQDTPPRTGFRALAEWSAEAEDPRIPICPAFFAGRGVLRMAMGVFASRRTMAGLAGGSGAGGAGGWDYGCAVDGG